MEQPSKITKALPLIFIAVAAVIGWQVGYWQASESLKKRFPEYQSVPALANSKSVSGTIDRVEGDTVYVKTWPLNPFERKQNTIAVVITASTIIEKLEPKSQELLNEELRNFTKTSKTGSTVPPMPPEPFVRRALQASDLMAGQSVSVITAEEISRATRVTAVSIFIAMPPPEVVVPPPPPMKTN
ncbi:MAG: hypothetical protein Q8Q36_00445 [bacterium]|nr:hypothetical protein [bacterium]